MKIIISILTVATLAAVIMAIGAQTPAPVTPSAAPSIWSTASVGFIIAFMGWMPIPLDASIWHSVWTKEKAFYSKQPLSKKGAFADFNVGYLSAAFIGLLFFLLGVLVMFGSGTSFSDSSVEFSSQLVELYGSTLGSWSKPIIAIAAFFTMLSTVMTVTDAYPRVISEKLAHESRYLKNQKAKRRFLTGVSSSFRWFPFLFCSYFKDPLPD